jgi:hypothetical protein
VNVFACASVTCGNTGFGSSGVTCGFGCGFGFGAGGFSGCWSSFTSEIEDEPDSTGFVDAALVRA